MLYEWLETRVKPYSLKKFPKNMITLDDNDDVYKSKQ